MKPIVLVLVGPPASGKSTWSTKFLSSEVNWVRTNRDSIRFMLQNKPFLSMDLEKGLITDIMAYTIKRSLQLKYNNIVDNTNCTYQRIEEIKDIVGNKAELHFKFFDVPLDVLLERDRNRERSVGEEIITKMWNDFQTLKKNHVCKSCKGTGKYKKSDCAICQGSGIKIKFKWKQLERLKSFLRDVLKTFKPNSKKILS